MPIRLGQLAQPERHDLLREVRHRELQDRRRDHVDGTSAPPVLLTATRSPTGRSTPGREIFDHHRAADQRSTGSRRCSSTRFSATSGSTHVGVASTSLRQTFRSAEARVQGDAVGEHPDAFKGQILPSARCLDALDIPHVEIGDGSGRRRHRHLHDPGRGRGDGRPHVTGDRDAYQPSVRTSPCSTRKKGVSDPRMTPEVVEGEVRPHAGAVPRLRRPARRPQRQPPVHPRAWGEDGVEVGARVRARSPSWSNRVGEVKAGSATRCARRCPTSSATAALTELVRDAAAGRPRGLARRPFERERVHEVFDALQFRGAARAPFASTPTTPRQPSDAGRGRGRDPRAGVAPPGRRATPEHGRRAHRRRRGRHDTGPRHGRRGVRWRRRTGPWRTCR